MGFFNKVKYSVSKLTDQINIKADALFVVPCFIWDSISNTVPTSITAKLTKVDGRNITDLTTVVTVTNTELRTYTFSATPLSTEWTTQGLNLVVNIDGNIITIPLVIKV